MCLCGTSLWPANGRCSRFLFGASGNAVLWFICAFLCLLSGEAVEVDSRSYSATIGGHLWFPTKQNGRKRKRSGRFTPPFRPICAAAQKFQSPTAVAQNLELGSQLPFSILLHVVSVNSIEPGDTLMRCSAIFWPTGRFVVSFTTPSSRDDFIIIAPTSWFKLIFKKIQKCFDYGKSRNELNSGFGGQVGRRGDSRPSQQRHGRLAF